ncbi:MAG: tRNA preQ1(34) S-adenosylmethionine ribosyltransferase-isomerase QueA [Ilumatobacter fluminis]|uniref:tRNA preQ1(34) S-adenosylmethionine ribosyltransferase-isomerase QueA n=1 Tax=Ilumatobacter fluminis TaxID=467091 RepID=UPI0032EBF2A6
MLLSDFDYDLPDERIAQTPIEPRDAARLLVDRGSDAPDHRRVRDLPEILRPGDLLVVNETKVIPARLSVQRATGGKAEVLMLEPLDGERRVWEAMVRPARKLKPGEQLLAPDGTPVVEMGERTEAGDTFTVTVLGSIDSLDVLADHGEMPLPPYITERLGDPDRYQTVYAREPGSAAAPTAGLHFTSELLDRLAERGVETAKVELVVGLDTFRPVMEDDPTEHRMHTEQYRVPQQTMDRCLATRASGGRVVCVGTTSVRALESAATRGELEGRTDIFIHGDYNWQLVDVLMTNFHLPKTTLLMMIHAFVGDRWRSLYDEALEHDYRFLSFGDAMLLDRGTSTSKRSG